MTTLRVGEAGATVFDGEGTVLAVLPPGSVVVVGVTETMPDESVIVRAARIAREKRRVRDYADKRLRDYSDKGR